MKHATLTLSIDLTHHTPEEREALAAAFVGEGGTHTLERLHLTAPDLQLTESPTITILQGTAGQVDLHMEAHTAPTLRRQQATTGAGESLSVGTWCTECEYFEVPDDDGTTCLACGCPVDTHRTAQVTAL